MSELKDELAILLALNDCSRLEHLEEEIFKDRVALEFYANKLLETNYFIEQMPTLEEKLLVLAEDVFEQRWPLLDKHVLLTEKRVFCNTDTANALLCYISRTHTDRWQDMEWVVNYVGIDRYTVWEYSERFNLNLSDFVGLEN